MPPYDLIKHQLPFPLYPYQVNTVNELAPLPRSALYLEVGTGKTIASIAMCLYKLKTREIRRVVCIMPPVLLTNWSRVLSKVGGVSNVIYRGSPKERAEIDLDAHFILAGYQIFKKDYDYLLEQLGDDSLAVICDEAQAIKNIDTDCHRRVRDFSAGQHLILLTGTPLTSSPLDAYGYISLIAPGIYRSYYAFEQTHVAERDFFKKPTAYNNLDLLRQNMDINSVTIKQRDALKDLPDLIYNPIYYDLDPAHLNLYRKLADEQLVKFDNGEKLDLTNVNALLHALGQIPMNAEHFSEGKVKSTGVDLLEEIMDELGDGKLVAFTNYRMTNRKLLEHCKKYGVVAIYGDITAKAKQDAIDRFCNDPKCRLILLQMKAGSAGIDGLQHVSNNVLFLEMTHVPTEMEQAIGRVMRSGQTLPVNVRFAVAEGTVQKHILDSATKKSDILAMCHNGAVSLRKAIFGM